jgi:RNA polymerase sigma-70 factor (sigma-E family)
VAETGEDVLSLGRPGKDVGADADEAIESLFHAHYPRLAYTAFSLVGDWDLAEQIAQESFLRIWRRWRWINDKQAAPFYLQRTVVNLSRETIRRRMVERRVMRAQGAERQPGPAPDPAETLALRQAIAALPARKRECVVLRYLIGMTEAETARVLGVSLGTVKSQTHKGLSQMRDQLGTLLATEGPGTDSPIAPERNKR